MIFQLCGVKVIVSNNEVLMKIGKKVLGKRMFAALMKPTFYGQFVAGEVKKGNQTLEFQSKFYIIRMHEESLQ